MDVRARALVVSLGVLIVVSSGRGVDAAVPSASPHPPEGASGESRPSPHPAGRLSGRHVLGSIRTTQRVAALTLDDGYSPDPRLLDYLQATHLHGTAFIVGWVADHDPAFVRHVAALGWMVCSHTYDHKILTHLKDFDIRTEIVRGQDAVARVVGYRCPYFRAPGGAVDGRVLAITDALGLRVVGWSTSIADWEPKLTPADQAVIAFKYMRPGAILLGHWGGVHSYVVLKVVVDQLLASGYRIGSVDELVHGTIPPPAPVGRRLPIASFKPAAGGLQIVRALRGPGNLALMTLGVLLVAFLVRVEYVRRRHQRRRSSVLTRSS